MMSSMTAAPRMIWLSGSCRRPRSERTRAVMPTLVAVRAAPATMATRFAEAEQAAGAVAQGERQDDADRGDGRRGPADLQQLPQVGLQADGEQQQDDPELGEQVDHLDLGVDQPQDRGAEQHARHQFAEDGRLADGLGQGPAEPRRGRA